MSELLTKILEGNLSNKVVVSWILTGDVTDLKNGINQIEFSSFLLVFLRKHTEPLLSAQETLLSTLSPAPTTSPSICTTPPLNRSTKTLKPRSPFIPSQNSTPEPNPVVSIPSFNLLEKRLTSKEKHSQTATKVVKLTDFVIVKEKQKKKKKRIQPVPCDFNENHQNVMIVSEKEDGIYKRNEEKIRRVKPIAANEWKDLPIGHSTPVKILKHVNLENRVVQSGPDFPPKKREQYQSTEQLKLMERIEPTHISCYTTDNASEKVPNSQETREHISAEDISSIKEQHKELIDKLSALYSAVLTSNFIQDLLKELNYLMNLLISSKQLESSQPCICSAELIENKTFVHSENICLFKSNTEAIYFAASVLKQVWNLLKYLNKSTLNLLSSKTSLAVVVPDFVDQIKEYIEMKIFTYQDINIVDNEILNATVKFKMDTDCRPNYANAELFCAFKKQRDQFYSLLQDWEEDEGHETSADFFKAKHKSLRAIFTFSNASTNMHRLADLFVSQILASVFNEDFNNCKNLTMSGVSMTKVYLLNRRFVTPCSILLSNDKRFPGVQEFFKDFLRSCESPAFLSHVKDVLVHRIISLNQIKFSDQTSVAAVRQECFLVCINKLCLLAKFLSLITFFPYKDKESVPPHFRIPLVEARKFILPPLDIDFYLSEAISCGRLVVTVPWIVEFLNGIDCTSIHLQCYQKLFVKLQYLLYKIKLPSTSAEVKENIFLLLNEDIKSVIGVTDDKIGLKQLEYLSTNSKDDFTRIFVHECLRTIDCSQILITLYVNSLFINVPTSTIIKVEEMSTLKVQPILISSEFYIDETALYQCCPQLLEIKLLLEGGEKILYKSTIAKTEKTFCDQKTNNIPLDMKLEMHFFENMSLTVKRTVDIVAKQLSSNCESALRANLIPELKLKFNNLLRPALIEGKQLNEMMDLMSAMFYKVLKDGVDKELSTLHESIEHSLKGMLKPEVRVDENIFDICCNITCRKCFEMIYNWILNYISFRGIFDEVQKTIHEEGFRVKSIAHKSIEEKKSKKIKMEAIKTSFEKSKLSMCGLQQCTSPEPAQILHNLRHFSRILIAQSPVSLGLGDNDELHLTRVTVTFDNVIEVLDTAIRCIKTRADLQFNAFRRILLSSLDLISILVFLWPQLVVSLTLQKFEVLWELKNECKLHLPFEQILSIRNVDLLNQVTEDHQKSVFDALENYLSFSLEKKLMRTSKLFCQVLKLLQYEWPEKLISCVIGHVRESLKRSSSSNMKILNALESLRSFDLYLE